MQHISTLATLETQFKLLDVAFKAASSGAENTPVLREPAVSEVLRRVQKQAGKPSPRGWHLSRYLRATCVGVCQGGGGMPKPAAQQLQLL